VCWPDDSSYHHALAIPPGRRTRWLDIATGAAFAPLMRPELAATIVGAELNPRAVELARLGVALSELAPRVSIVESDLTARVPGTFSFRLPWPSCSHLCWRRWCGVWSARDWDVVRPSGSR
jgi:hypothetical protein